jgi:hypothetical protein
MAASSRPQAGLKPARVRRSPGSAVGAYAAFLRPALPTVDAGFHPYPPPPSPQLLLQPAASEPAGVGRLLAFRSAAALAPDAPDAAAALALAAACGGDSGSSAGAGGLPPRGASE